jgi:hypothetical protein
MQKEAAANDADDDNDERGWLDGNENELDQDLNQSADEPVDLKALRALLGAAGYHRPCVRRNFAEVTFDLRELVKSGENACWGPKAELAFRELLRGLTLAPIVHRRDASLPLLLETDWSARGKGAVLSQLRPKPHLRNAPSDFVDNNGILQDEYCKKSEREKLFDVEPLRYISEANTEPDAKLCPREGEAVSAVYAVKRLRGMLLGVPFILATDHSSLRWIKESTSDRCFRWSLLLAQFEYKVVYQPGLANALADGLSRYISNPDALEDDEECILPAYSATPGDLGLICFAANAEEEDTVAYEEDFESAGAKLFLRTGCTAPRCWCTLARAKKNPTLKKRADGKADGANKFLDVVHADDLGEVEQSASGNKWATVLTDGATSWREVYCSRHKNAAAHAGAFENFVAGNGPSKAFHADGAFTAVQLPRSAGRRIPTPAYEHHNPTAERSIGLLTTDGRVLILGAQRATGGNAATNLLANFKPAKYWDYAVKYAAVLRNHVTPRGKAAAPLEARRGALKEKRSAMGLFEWGTVVGFVPAKQPTKTRRFHASDRRGIYLGWKFFAPRGNSHVLLTKSGIVHVDSVFEYNA